MSKLIVTPRSNIKADEEGNIVFDDEGIPEIKDEEAIGMMLKTHVIQVSQLNPESNRLETGCIFRCEVAWEHKRCPAVSMEDPDDLVWLSLDAETAADETDENDEDDDDEYEGSQTGLDHALHL